MVLPLSSKKYKPQNFCHSNDESFNLKNYIENLIHEKYNFALKNHEMSKEKPC